MTRTGRAEPMVPTGRTGRTGQADQAGRRGRARRGASVGREGRAYRLRRRSDESWDPGAVGAARRVAARKRTHCPRGRGACFRGPSAPSATGHPEPTPH